MTSMSRSRRRAQRRRRTTPRRCSSPSFRLPAPGSPAGTNPSDESELATPDGPTSTILSVTVLPGLVWPSSFYGQRARNSTPPGPYVTPPSLYAASAYRVASCSTEAADVTRLSRVTPISYSAPFEPFAAAPDQQAVGRAGLDRQPAERPGTPGGEPISRTEYASANGSATVGVWAERTAQARRNATQAATAARTPFRSHRLVPSRRGDTTDRRHARQRRAGLPVRFPSNRACDTSARWTRHRCGTLRSDARRHRGVVHP